ncbi:MADS-box protein SOC1-like [Quillaja saponaria]|uniref:MADS-box protein SOC1-like n=1 Tax=Quillaja saponaria TaxID=32244 RepID=A0AAD7VHH6_QUISA|nr:MADS-box protein SOC1-like [Quillaja saponaria]
MIVPVWEMTLISFFKFLRKLVGDDLNSCSYRQLEQIENQLKKSLVTVRVRKAQLLADYVKKLRAKDKYLLEENLRLSENCGEKAWQPVTKKKRKSVAAIRC